jgi:general secretion pathway protein D
MFRPYCDFFAVRAAVRWRPLALAAALAVAAACAQAQERPPAASANRSGDAVTLDFANAEIDAVARTLATITGRNVVVDPRVKGTLSLTSTTPVSSAEALRMFAAQLRAQGFALVDSNGLYLVLPEADAKLQSGAVSARPTPAAGGQIVTQIFRLTYENANNLVPILRPLISPNNTINVNPGANAIVITDYADNLQRLGRIIAALDVSNATGVEVVRLNYAVASDLAPLVARLLEPGGSGAAAMPQQAAPAQPGGISNAVLSVGSSGDGYRTTLAPEPRSNAIIVRAANPARLALARSLIQQLDQPPSNRADGSSGNIHVVYLKNADAAKLAVTLRAALAALPGQPASPAGGGGSSGHGGGLSASSSGQGFNNSASGQNSLASGPSIDAAGSNQPSTGGQIQADPATNSLIISAPEPVYRELRAVIDQLDQRRAQVFVESLIAEVRADKAADFGVQWQGLMGNGNSSIGVIGTNYLTPRATGSDPINIINFGAQFLGMKGADWVPSVQPNTGFNLIAASRTLGILANFIQSSGAGNVLSTPTLLTLDNEEAKIIVGQNVPFITGGYTTNTGGGNVVGNPFNTYERKDVGLTLRVRPQISEDGTIKMVIYQEVSSLVNGTATSPNGPITNKRAIESSVLVDDGAIVALGGLLEDQYSSSEDKVPVLGDIPLLGNLFKSRNRSYVKTNLMVFLRPVIVRDAASSESYSLSRYEMMRAAQQATQPQPSAVLQVNQSPVLPQVTPVRPDAWTRPAPPPPLINPPAGDSNLYGY